MITRLTLFNILYLPDPVLGLEALSLSETTIPIIPIPRESPTFNEILRNTIYVALVGLVVSLSFLCYRLEQTLDKANKLLVQSTQTAQAVGKLAIDSKDIIIQEQRYLKKDLPNTLSKIDHSLESLDGVLLSTTQAIGTINATVASAQRDEHQLLTQTSTDAHAISLSTQTTIASVQPLVAAANQSINSLNKATLDLDDLILDPDIKATLSNVTSTTKSVSGMADDTAHYWHGILHPTWAKKVWSFATGTGVGVATHLVP
jgi:hypothetical protein